MTDNGKQSIGLGSSGNIQAKGNVNFEKNELHINIPSNSLQKAIQSIVDEFGYNKEYVEFIEELTYYIKARNGNALGLEEKLKLGNRSDLIDDALELKEKFAKKISKSQLNIVTQKVYIQILSNINALFRNKIKPLILKNEPIHVVDNAIQNEVIEYIYGQISTHSFVNLDMDDIHGMLYYLSGKCHINWC